MSATKQGRSRECNAEAESEPGDDTLLRGLTREDRAKLSMDAWEPSLLRKLLRAHGRFRAPPKDR